MRNNLRALIRIQWHNAWGSLVNQKRRTRYILMAVLLFLAVLVLFVFMVMNAVATITLFQQAGVAHFALVGGVSTSLMIALLTSCFRIGVGSSHHDANLLLSLPVEKGVILLSKSLTQYLFELVIILVYWTPTLFVYHTLIDPSAALLLRGLLFLFLLPLTSLGLSHFFSWLLFHAGGRLRHPELITTLLNIGVIILLFATFLNVTIPVSASQLPELTVTRFTGLIAEFILNGYWAGLLILLAITSVPIFAGMVLLSRIFGLQPRVYSSGRTNLVIKISHVFPALLGREFRFYFAFPIYVVNTIFGPLMALVSTVALIAYRADVLSLLTMPETIMLVPLLSRLCLVIIVFFTTLTCISCSSISLEKENLRILKSAPIPEHVIFLSKLLLHMIFILPPCLAFSVTASILFSFSLTESLLLAGCSLLSCTMTAQLGLYINLLYPKMEYASPTSVVKQSAASGLTVLFGIALGILSILPGILTESPIVGLLVPLAIHLILNAALGFLLFTNGKRRFREL